MLSLKERVARKRQFDWKSLTTAAFLLISLADITRAQSTNIAIGTSVLQPSVKQFGINLGTVTNYDSGQMMKNLIVGNPGFEGQVFNSIIQCASGTATSCTDANTNSSWPAGFWDNATYQFFYGAAAGRSGTVHYSSLPAYGGGGTFQFNDSGTPPAAGDYMVVRMSISGDSVGGWFPTTYGAATIGDNKTDLPPGTLGQQTTILTAPTSSDLAGLAYYFDGSPNRSFVQLNGTYQLQFKAKGIAGSEQINLVLSRNSGATYISQIVPLTNTWSTYTFTFSASESGSALGSVGLSFATVYGADTFELDDVTLTKANGDPTNQTVFSDPVVNALRAYQPGILRYWGNNGQLGETLNNLLTPQFGRQRAGYSAYTSEVDQLDIGLHEFLVLCQTVGAEPWFVVPSTFSTTDAANLIEYLASSNTTTYGAIRSNLGQSAPWTTVFPKIHLEFGNEAWNGVFQGGTIVDGYAYASQAQNIFAAMRSDPAYSASAFDLVLGGQAAAPGRNNIIQNNCNNNDSLDIAPYTMSTVDSYSDNQSLFGSTFAEPEAFVSSASTSSAEGLSPGLIYQNYEQIQQSSKPVPLSFYEVNMSTLGGSITQQALNSYVSSVGAGLMVADTMLQSLKQYGVVNQNLFSLPQYSFNRQDGSSVYLWGSVVDMGVTNLKRPQFLALALTNQALSSGAAMLQTTHSGADPTWNQPLVNTVQIDNAHYLQSFAFQQGQSLSTIIFNFSLTASLPVTFSGPNAPSGTVQIQQLTSANVTDTNELSDVVNTTSTVSTNFSASTGLTLPPFSMTVLTWTSAASTQAPLISRVRVSGITSTSATVNWTTDQPSSSQVNYGTSTAYGQSSTSSAALSTNHSVLLTGLTSGTTYNFDLASVNSAGTQGTSANSTFSTPPPAPVISAITVTSVTATSVTVNWTTDQASTSQLLYGPTSTYSSAILSSALVTSHSLVVSGLSGGSTYNFNLTSANSSGGVGTSSNLTFSTISAPVISAISASPTSSSSVTVTWTTDQPSTSQVVYGSTLPYGSASPANSTLTTTHTVNITGLTPNTNYNYSVISADSYGLSSSSANFTFTTSGQPPLITYVSATAISNNTAVINWTTDIASSSQVNYGTTSSVGTLSSLNSNATTSHSVTLTGLAIGTTYYYRVLSTGSTGGTKTSDTYAFTTTGGSTTTNIAVSSSILQPTVKRLGLNLGSLTYYDSGQMMKNMIIQNPGFEGQIWNATVQCASGTSSSCVDANQYSQWPTNFWNGATYQIFHGSAAGRSGTIYNYIAATSGQGGTFYFADSGTAPAQGDYMIVRESIPGGSVGGWQAELFGAASVSDNTTDLPPGTQGKQTINLTAPTSNDQVILSTYLDSTPGVSFVQLNGTYQLQFQAKGTSGSNQVSVRVQRNNGASFVNETLNLTNSWSTYTLNFTASETGTSTGAIGIYFSTVNGIDSFHLDNVSLTQTNSDATNPTVFTDSVVNTIRTLQPGILRYWGGNGQLGETLDNLLTPQLGRQRVGYLASITQANQIDYGLHEFLVLCQTVGAEPWFVVPSTFSATDAANLIEYLAGANTTTYGAKRAVLGQNAPWTQVFSTIHLEFGEQEWNTAYLGGTILDAASYASQAQTIFAAMQSNAAYVPGVFDFVLGGQAGAPQFNTAIQNLCTNNTSFDVAPYTMGNISSYSDNESLFGSTFAEPEALVSSSASAEGLTPGLLYQDYQALQASSHPVPLSFSEINLSPQSGSITQQALNSYASSLGAGLMVADTMLQGLKQFGVVNQNLFSLPQYQTPGPNGTSMYLYGSVVDMGVTNRRRPQYLALQLANQALTPGANMLQTSHTGANPTWDEPLINSVYITGAHDLQSYAFQNGTSFSLVVFNFSRTSSLPVTFSGVNAPTGTVQVQQLTSANLTDTNEISQVVGTTTTTLTGFNSSSALSLPPYSMTVLNWNSSGSQAPIISSVGASGLTSTSATISWVTDQPATSQVNYGTTTGYGLASTLNAALTTQHSVSLTGLTPGTTYDVQALSANSSSISGTSVNFTFSTPLSGPTISAITVTSVTNNSAIITWTTDQASTSQVLYGSTASYGSEALSGSLVTSHSVTLTNLLGGTAYNFQVTSANSLNAISTSANLTFSTVGPPTISNIAVSNIGSTTATISWTTNQASSSQVQYGVSIPYGAATTPNASLVTSHLLTLTGLTPGTNYNFSILSANSYGESANSANSTFSTLGGATASVSPGSLTLSSTMNTVSAAQTVTLSNSGTAALTVSGVAASGTGFAIATNTCGATVAAGGSCAVGVTYTPAATGSVTGALTFTDNSSTGTTQTVTLTGTGTAAGSGATATYNGLDTTTLGTWTGKYGADGFQIANNNSANVLPGYVTMSMTGASTFTWAKGSSDARALQTFTGAPVGSGIESIYYSTNTSFSISLNLTDGNAHAVGMYLLDLDGGRSETITIADAVSGTVLSTQSYSSFGGGEYASWTIRGNVIITVTQTGAQNAVVSGLFFGSGATTSALSAAAYNGVDTTTLGTWTGKYGGDGFQIANDSSSQLPGYASLSLSGASTYTYVNPSSDARALQTASGAAAGIVSAYYSNGLSYTINLNLTDGNTHPVALYLLDWDGGRSETVVITDAVNNAVLSVQSYAGFTGGEYASWNLKGHVNITVTSTSTAGLNAVYSGIFFGSGATQSATASVSPGSLTLSSTVNTVSAAQTVTLSNSGTAALTVSGVAASGTGFAIATNTCGATVAAGGSCAVGVTYTPAATGSVTGALTFTDNSSTGTTQTVTLSGTAGLQAQTITFGAIAAQKVGTPLTLTATASSGLAVTYASTTASVCTVSGSTATFVAAGTCSITASQAGNSTYAAATPVTQSFSVAAAAVATASVSPGSLTLSSTVNTVSAAQTVTLSNTGTAALTVSGVAASGTGFAIATNTCGATVAAGGSCAVGVTYTPAATGSVTGALTFTDNSSTGTTQTVTLSGTAGLQAQTITFGAIAAQKVGTPLTLTATASSGLAVTYASTTASVCTVSGSTATFVAAGTCSITASQAGNSTYAAATPVTQSFSVAAAAVATASVSPGSLTLSSTVNTVSAAQTVTLSNTGTAALTVSGVAASGTGFAIATNTCGATVAAGGSCAVGVTYTPAATGSVTGALTFTDNSSTGTTQTVTLTGTGTAAGSGATATYNGLDTTTLGTWTGKYGADGFQIANNNSANVLPGYVTMSMTGASTFTWAKGSSDARALQTFTGAPVGSGIESIYYSTNTSFSISLNLTDGNAHAVGMYLLDLDGGRSETITIADAVSGTVLSTQSYSSFGGGEYASWTIRGNVIITVTQTGAQNAVVSGLFFGSGATTSALSAAAYNGVDTTTLGTWTGKYGGDGFQIANDSSSQLPGYASLSLSGASTYTYVNPSSDARALQTASGAAAGIVSAYYSNGLSYTINLNLTDGNTHPVALYLLDWDGGRSETVVITDAVNNAVLSVQSYAGFTGGEYASWNLKGHVNITVTSTSTAGLNAVYSGIFFGSGATQSATASVSPGSLTLSSTVNTVSAAQTVTLSNSGTAALTVSGVAASGTGFAIATNTCGATVAAGGSCAVGVTYTPAATGSVTGALTFTDNSSTGTTQTVTLSGTAGLQAQTITFGAIAAQKVGTPLTLTATASSGLAVTYASTTASVCTVSGSTATFVAAGTCSITASQAGNSTYAAATPVTQSFSVAAAAVATASVSPGSLTLSSTVNTVSAAQTVTLSNTGTAALTVSGVAASGTGFAIATNTCGATVAAGGSCAVGVTYTPAATGSVTGALTFTDNSSTGTTQTVTLSGTAGLQAQTITFGAIAAQKVGTPLTLTATASSGLAVTYASTTASVCTVSGSTATFVAAGTCSITASQAGNSTYAAATPVTQSFSVAAAAVATASVSPGSLTLSSTMNTVSAAQTVTLSNSGTAALTVSGVAASGTGFAIATNTCGATVAAGGSCAVGVTYTPAATGSVTGALTFTDNSSTGTTQTVTLTGTGTAAGSGATATYNGLDTTTLGTWTGKYGADGFQIANNNSANVLPGYVTMSMTGASTFTWAKGSSDARALQTFTGAPVGSGIESIYYSTNTSFSISLNLTDGNAHAVGMYLLDLDGGRSETITIADAVSGTVLSTQSYSSFGGGEYASWTIRGNVIITVTQTGAQNAVVSGLFFGSGATTSALSAAAYNGVDTTTLGTWTGKYGGDGFQIANDSSSQLPGYASLSLSGASTYTYVNPSSDARALQTASGAAAGIVSAYYSNGLSYTINLNLTDGNTHPVALYLLDWDGGRSETVVITDAVNNAVLSVQSYAGFTGGEYASWNLKGHVNITVTSTSTAGLNAVYSGIFFGSGATQSATASVSPGSLTLSSTVNTVSAAQTVTLSNSGTAALTVSGVAASGTGFAIATNTCGATVAAGGSCAVGVTYTPAATGSVTGALTFTDNSSTGTTQTVTLSGTAGLQAQTMTFGAIAAQKVGTPLTLTATASSGLAVTYASTTASVCTVSGSTATFVAAGTCSITASQAGNSTYAAATPVTQSFSVAAAAVATASVSPGSLTLSSTVNTVSAAQTVTLSNTGTAALTVSGVAASGTGFAIATNTCGATVAAGGSCAVGVTYTPAATGSVTGALTFTDNSSTGTTQTVTLSGTAGLQAQTITFGAIAAQKVGTPLTLTATASSGLAVTYASTTASVCTVSGSTATFVAAGTCSITASQAGNSTYAAATPVTQSFSVAAAAVATASVSPGSLTLSSTMNTVSAAQTVTLSNSGTAALTVSGVAASGTGFAIATNTCGATVAAGGSCAVGVTYTPAATGSVTGALTFTDNSSTGTTQTVTLTGTGTAAGSGATATYNGLDTTTLGTWTGKYGADGFQIANNNSANVLPGYVTMSMTGASTFTWAKGSSDARALQTFTGAPVGSGIESIYYSTNTSFSISLNLTDGNAHAVGMYLLDLDGGRSETITIADAVSGTVLSTQSYSSFGGGEYASWTIRGNVIITVTQTGAQNAVVSGLFFGSGATTSALSAAAYNGVDTTTLGTWTGKYGGDGFQIANDSSSQLPGYASLSLSGASTYTYVNPSSDARALQTASGAAAGIVSAYYSNGLSYTINLNLTDGNTHPVALYLLDWDGGRSETVVITDAVNNAVLSVQSYAGFTGGEYASWNLKGHVNITVTSTNTAGLNAVYSGIFFGL